MSRLKLYWPEEVSRSTLPRYTKVESIAAATETPVVPFRHYTVETSRQSIDPLSRAQLIHANQQCPHCQHPVVEPVELQDALLNRNRMPIPGTATLVGFHCDRCHAEWPA